MTATSDLDRNVASSRSSWRQLLPREHGAWGLLGEPLLLGLLVAPSTAGGLLAVAAVACFLAWRPLKSLAGVQLCPAAAPATAALLAVAAAATGLAVRLAGAGVLAPAVIAAPLLAVWGLYDLNRRGRERIAELAGPLSLAGAAPAIALAGGAEAAIAWALWPALATRSLPSVLYIRTRLRRQRGWTASRTLPLVAHLLGLAVMVALAVSHLVPWPGVVVSAALLVRAAWGLARADRPVRAQRIGFAEVAWGIVFVLAVGL